MGAELDAVEQFGPYLVYERLGIGGMATVHRALERGIEGFERVVALKRLLPHLAEDGSFIKAFVREAKLASLLDHVNIGHIFELGRVGTQYFISMEYIDGRDLRRLLRQARNAAGPPPVNVVVGLLLQLCDALDFAHNRCDDNGQPLMLVHRDVSPSNVLVTSGGFVKVIDFGIAKAQSSQLRTQTGRVKGKLAYMAPEAVAGRELDARCDLWAVGVIAHELLTARPLFASRNEYETLTKVERGDIPTPSTFNPSVPLELDAIVLKALSRDRAERFADAGELRAELLGMRRIYDLQTEAADIAAWVEWAFTLEPTARRGEDPGGATERDEDDPLEHAWGGGDRSDAGPIVLDDVPDVSAKHFGLAVDDLGDDIPTPVPSHGGPARPSLRAIDLFGDGEEDAAPRVRMSTAAGHTPAPATPSSGRRVSRRMQTQTTDPDGQRLLDALEIPVDADADAGATVPSFPVADDAATTQPMLPAEVREPTIRFKTPSLPPAIVPAGAVKPVRTKPGYSPARAATAAAPSDDDAAATLARSRPARPRGARGGPSKPVIIIAAVFALSAIATAVVMFVQRRSTTASTEKPAPIVNRPAPSEAVAPAPGEAPGPTPTAAAKPDPTATTAKVRFVLEPPDSEIWIADTFVHAGTPWSTSLAAGVHQIQVVRTGYKAWLTSLELSARDDQTVRVVLEPIDDEMIAEAVLRLGSDPPGLEVVLDGVLLTTRTPITMTLPVGPHTVVLRQNGIDVWRHELDATASATYEFSPSMDPAKRRERAERSDPTAPQPPPSRTPADDRLMPPGDEGPPGTAAAATPITVPPSAVTKESGGTPELVKLGAGKLPAVATATLCIDAAGAVTTATMVTRLAGPVAETALVTLRTWRYKPYLEDDKPIPVCFATSFRVR